MSVAAADVPAVLAAAPLSTGRWLVLPTALVNATSCSCVARIAAASCIPASDAVACTCAAAIVTDVGRVASGLGGSIDGANTVDVAGPNP